MREGTQGSKGMEQSRTGTPVPGTAVGSSPGSTSRQRRLLSRRVLGGSSPSIPGQLGQEETGLGSADEVSDIHGSLSLHEVPDEMGREDSSRRQPASRPRFRCRRSPRCGGPQGDAATSRTPAAAPTFAFGAVGPVGAAVPRSSRPAGRERREQPRVAAAPCT